ncbi:pseudouridine synthase [Gloeopeniophorella convolvens]|nr:pseudouridine synthase [Gloeopeniophorella convolvens]
MAGKYGAKKALGQAGRAITSSNVLARPGKPPSALYVDRGVIVLNKPPGLVSQGSLNTKSAGPSRARSELHFVIDGLRRKYGVESDPFPVHRLDKGTTGALILARTISLARELSQQFRTHAVEKTYLALVRGGAKTFPTKEGLISGALSFENGRVRIGAETEPGSKPARTAWEVLASSDVAPLSLLRLHLHTGLKHQLRVHMAHVLKAPVLGDGFYGSAVPAEQILARSRVPADRLFLHSSSISFWRYRREGPRKRFRLTVTAPLPADFTVICRDMRMQLPEDAVRGGVFVDGVRIEGEEIPDVEGRWLGEPSSS